MHKRLFGPFVEQVDACRPEPRAAVGVQFLDHPGVERVAAERRVDHGFADGDRRVPCTGDLEHLCPHDLGPRPLRRRQRVEAGDPLGSGWKLERRSPRRRRPRCRERCPARRRCLRPPPLVGRCVLGRRGDVEATPIELQRTRRWRCHPSPRRRRGGSRTVHRGSSRPAVSAPRRPEATESCGLGYLTTGVARHPSTISEDGGHGEPDRTHPTSDPRVREHRAGRPDDRHPQQHRRHPPPPHHVRPDRAGDAAVATRPAPTDTSAIAASRAAVDSPCRQASAPRPAVRASASSAGHTVAVRTSKIADVGTTRPGPREAELGTHHPPRLRPARPPARSGARA